MIKDLIEIDDSVKLQDLNIRRITKFLWQKRWEYNENRKYKRLYKCFK